LLQIGSAEFKKISAPLKFHGFLMGSGGSIQPPASISIPFSADFVLFLWNIRPHRRFNPDTFFRLFQEHRSSLPHHSIHFAIHVFGRLFFDLMLRFNV
jgi:hypothetical protein